jgi:hypothetical protein
MDRISLWPAAQSMKIKAGLTQRIQARRRIQRIEPNQRAFSQIGPDPSRLSGLKQLFQTAVPEASDHDLCKPVPGGS